MPTRFAGLLAASLVLAAPARAAGPAPRQLAIRAAAMLDVVSGELRRDPMLVDRKSVV